MADLVSGAFPQHSPWASLLGNLANETQANIPARGNHEYFGMSAPTDGALAASGVAAIAAVPMDPGTVITRVSMVVGATAASTPTHTFVAIYSGIATPALLGTQGTDTTTTAVAASALFSQKLGSPYMVKQADCANGYIYVVYSQTATAVNTALTFGIPTAVGYQAFTAATTPAAVQPMLAATSGSSLAGTAAATLTLTAAARAPWFILT